jgi:hypothetical protein
MSKTKKILGMSALGLGIIVSIPVLAHGPGMAMHGPGGNMKHSGMMHSEANVEQHLGQLKESLQITEAQQIAWESFEQAVKSMAANGPMTHNHEGHTPGGDMDNHFVQMEQRMAQMRSIHEARKALFNTLTDEQKKILENFMPGPFGHHG